MVAPVLPWLTDGRAHLDELLAGLADAGATGVTVLPLHLRGPVKPLFLAWLAAACARARAPLRGSVRARRLRAAGVRALARRARPAAARAARLRRPGGSPRRSVAGGGVPVREHRVGAAPASSQPSPRLSRFCSEVTRPPRTTSSGGRRVGARARATGGVEVPPYSRRCSDRRASRRAEARGDRRSQSTVGVPCRAGGEPTPTGGSFDGSHRRRRHVGGHARRGRAVDQLARGGRSSTSMVERADGTRVLLAPTAQRARTAWRRPTGSTRSTSCPCGSTRRGRATWDLTGGPTDGRPGGRRPGRSSGRRCSAILPRALVDARVRSTVQRTRSSRLVLAGVRTRGAAGRRAVRVRTPRRTAATRSSPRAFAGRASTWACSRTSSHPVRFGFSSTPRRPGVTRSARSSAAERGSWSGSPSRSPW